MSAMVVRRGGFTRLVVAGLAVLALADFANHGGLGAFGGGGGSTSAGHNVALGQKMAAAAPYHWTGGQFTCLNELWTRESGWSSTALNPTSGATGIPQLLPSAHSIPANWSDPATQVSWGLNYIATTPGYGTPCAAWGHELADGWY
jgi:hypothetical protein